MIYSGATFIGLMDRDFQQLSVILQALDKSIFCNERNCYGSNSCDYYSFIPDYTLTIGKTSNFTIPGGSLFEHADEKGGCMFALYAAGENYILGEFFLQHYYSVYDVIHGKIGLGKVKDLHAKNDLPDEISNPFGQSTPEESEFAARLVAGSAIAIGVMCLMATICIYKR